MNERIYEETSSGKIIPKEEIVRCKNCRYAENELISPITGKWCNRFGLKDMAVEDKDFCSHGERKEQNNEHK